MIPVWSFAAAPVAPRRPEVVLLAFGRGPLVDDVPMSAARFGVPDANALAAIEVTRVERARDSRWFDAWRSGSLRVIAEQDLDAAALAALDAADHVHVITTAPERPTDLGYLQAAWAFARYFAARGATVMLDAHAMTYAPARSLAPAGAPLDLVREVRRVYETTSTRADLAHALHTRGLRKFGAPDVIALCTDADARIVSALVGTVAEALARGVDPALPRHRFELAGGLAYYLVPDEHHLGDLLQLGNAARVLVDAAGNDLVGVAAR